MKKLYFLMFFIMFEAIMCHGNGIHGVSDFDKIRIGDELTSICNIDINEDDSYILCGSSRLYPFKRIQKGLDYIFVAYSNNKIIAVFYSYITINNQRIVPGITTIQDLKELTIKFKIEKESGFGYVLKIKDYDFIVSIGETGTDRYPKDNDKITSIIRR